MSKLSVDVRGSPQYQINVTLLKDFGYHEVANYDGDNHGVVLVDGDDTTDVSISESDRR